jgi:hypothetical protein
MQTLHWTRRRHRLLLLPALVAVGLLAFGCSSGGGPAPSAHAKSGNSQRAAPTSTTEATPATGVTPTTGGRSAGSTFQLPAALGSNVKPYWILEKFSVSPLLQAGLSQSMLQDYFNNPHTFVIVTSGDLSMDPLLPAATYVMDFHNAQQMMHALSVGSVPSYIKLLLYDDEKWPSTPVAQQQQPFTYEAEAEAAANQHGLGFVFTPAANLSTVLSTAYSNATKYDGYASLGIASQGAAHADVLEIQSQQDEGTSGFNSFVSTTVSQAKTANPSALVMVGLTTAAPRMAITPQILLNDYATTRPLVSGYWLNIPGGPGGPHNPQVAVAFLQALAPQLGY